MKKKEPEEDPEDLFRWGQEGRARRDEGMEQTLGHEPEVWKTNYFWILIEQPAELPVPFKGEDLRAYAAPLIGEPHDPHVWSASWMGAIKLGLIQKLEWVPSVNCTVNPKNHACSAPLYVWPGVEIDL